VIVCVIAVQLACVNALFVNMKKQTTGSAIEHVVKKTTIGNGRVSTSTMNKHKRRSFKKYRGQGKRR
jgi:hypothetical protein